MTCIQRGRAEILMSLLPAAFAWKTMEAPLLHFYIVSSKNLLQFLQHSVLLIVEMKASLLAWHRNSIKGMTDPARRYHNSWRNGRVPGVLFTA